MRSERWRSVDGFANYEVSDVGNVRSWRTRRRVGRRKSPVLLSLRLRNGYVAVTLQTEDGPRSLSVHRLVAAAFIQGKTAERRFVNHKDGDRTNNLATNLEWVTSQENMDHAVALGRIVCGDRHPNRLDPRRVRGSRNGRAKLTEADVLELRRLRSIGHSIRDLMKQFHVGETATRAAINGDLWSHVGA